MLCHGALWSVTKVSSSPPPTPACIIKNFSQYVISEMSFLLFMAASPTNVHSSAAGLWEPSSNLREIKSSQADLNLELLPRGVLTHREHNAHIAQFSSCLLAFHALSLGLQGLLTLVIRPTSIRKIKATLGRVAQRKRWCPPSKWGAGGLAFCLSSTPGYCVASHLWHPCRGGTTTTQTS